MNVFIPGTTWILVPQAVNITNLFLQAGIWRDQERKVTATKLSCDFDINERPGHSYEILNRYCTWSIHMLTESDMVCHTQQHPCPYFMPNKPPPQKKTLTFCWTVYLFKDNTTCTAAQQSLGVWLVLFKYIDILHTTATMFSTKPNSV